MEYVTQIVYEIECINTLKNPNIQYSSPLTRVFDYKRFVSNKGFIWATSNLQRLRETDQASTECHRHVIYVGQTKRSINTRIKEYQTNCDLKTHKFKLKHRTTVPEISSL